MKPHAEKHELEQKAFKLALRSANGESHRERRALDRLLSERWGHHMRLHKMQRRFHGREHDLVQRAIDLAAANEKEHFAELNQARERSADERNTFATKDQLGDKLSAIDARLQLIERALAQTTGRDRGFSQSWAILIAAVVLAVGVLDIGSRFIGR